MQAAARSPLEPHVPYGVVTVSAAALAWYAAWRCRMCCPGSLMPGSDDANVTARVATRSRSKQVVSDSNDPPKLSGAREQRADNAV